MIEIQPPAAIPKLNDDELLVFLAGSIEDADDWQRVIVETFSNVPNLVFLNPRRDHWDRSNEALIPQINWELDGIEQADLVFMHFVPGTISPISLLELGLLLKENLTIRPGRLRVTSQLTTRSNRLILSCPHEFWRETNVRVTADRHHQYVHGSLASAISELTELVDFFSKNA